MKLLYTFKIYATICVLAALSASYGRTLPARHAGATSANRSLKPASRRLLNLAAKYRQTFAGKSRASQAQWKASESRLYTKNKQSRARQGRRSASVSPRHGYRTQSIGAIVVNTTADDPAYDYTTSDTTASGAVSLRSAVQYTNYIAGPDSIIVPAGTYILATIGANESDAATGDLNINDTLTIVGAGEFQTVIDGDGADRVFGIDNYTLGIECTLSNLTIVDGIAPGSEDGGGIEIYAGTLNLDSVDVIQCSSSDYGGGIDLESGSLVMNYGALSQNGANSGGGGANVYSGTASFNHVTIDSNGSSTAGGILNNGVNSGGFITITGCLFLGDYCLSDDGGAAINAAGYMEIDSSTFKYCYAADVGAVGIYGGVGVIATSVFDSNYAAGYVGGVAVVPFGNAYSLSMTGDTLRWNMSEGGDGGGLYVAPIYSFYIGNSYLFQNSADQTGGGLYLDNGVDSLENCTISGNSSSEGGGIFNGGAYSVYMRNVQIDSNFSDDDGGGILDAEGDMNWYGGQFADNYANTAGNAMYFDAVDGNDSLFYVQFIGNSTGDIFNDNPEFQVVILGAPSARFTAASFSDSTVATLDGVVTPGIDTVAAIQFVYGNASGVYMDSVLASPSTATGSEDVPVTATLTGIDPSQTYYFRVSVLGSDGYYATSLESSFHTGGQSGNGYIFASKIGTFSSISGSGTPVGASGWDDHTQSNIPIGFTFYYNGAPYTEVAACSNGFLSFDSNTTDSPNGYTNISSGDSIDEDLSHDNGIAPYLAPLFGDLLVNGDIYYETVGSSPNRKFIMEWNNVAADWEYADSNSVSFQVILYEGSNKIEYVYSPGPQASSTFDNPSRSGLCVGIVDSLRHYVSLSALYAAPYISTTSEFDYLYSAPPDGLQFSFTPLTDYALAVKATDFLATADAGSATLTWKSQSEDDNAGYNILREDPGTSAFKLISSYTSDNSLKGLGTSSTGRTYSFTDQHVQSGATYKYRIQSVSTNGSVADLSTLSVTIDVPKTYALYQNYPNPFNPSTTVRFDLKQASTVTLEVFNTLGQRVEYWSYGVMNAGRYNEVVNMSQLASGIYLYRITAVGNNGERFSSIKKLVLMK